MCVRRHELTASVRGDWRCCAEAAIHNREGERKTELPGNICCSVLVILPTFKETDEHVRFINRLKSVMMWRSS